MTALTHARINGSIVAARITRERAIELYNEAAAHPQPALVALAGDAVRGFGFWEVYDGLQTVRVRVEPLPQENPAFH